MNEIVYSLICSAAIWFTALAVGFIFGHARGKRQGVESHIRRIPSSSFDGEEITSHQDSR